jgi:hypothetical protein
MLRRPAVNGIVVLQEGPKGGGGGSLRGSKDRKGKGKVDILGLGNESRGGIAGEYVLDPSLPKTLSTSPEVEAIFKEAPSENEDRSMGKDRRPSSRRRVEMWT